MYVDDFMKDSELIIIIFLALNVPLFTKKKSLTADKGKIVIIYN